MQIVKEWIIGNWINLGEDDRELTTSQKFFLDFLQLKDIWEGEPEEVAIKRAKLIENLENAVTKWCNIIESLDEKWINEFEKLLWRFDKKDIYLHLQDSVKKMKTELELKKIRIETWDKVKYVFITNEPE